MHTRSNYQRLSRTRILWFFYLDPTYNNTHVSDEPRWSGGSLQTCRGPGQHRGRGGRRRDAAAVRPRHRASRAAEHPGTSRRRAREGGRPGPWRRPGVAEDWQRRQ